MSWMDVLKRKKMSQWAKKIIIDVMADGEKRTAEEILDDMWDVVEQRKKAGTRQGPSPASGKFIPTNYELKHFLGLSENYEGGVFDTITGKQLQRKNLLKPYHKRYYWRV